MTKIYEVSLVPRDPNTSIIYIVVRVDDHININTHEKCMDFIEEQFPFYEVKEVLEGFKDETTPKEATKEYSFPDPVPRLDSKA